MAVRRNLKGKRSQPYKKRARKYTRPRKNFTRNVKKVISQLAETKQAFHNVNNVSFNSGINSAGDMNYCIPQIANGTGDSQRVGDILRAQKLTIKGHLTMSMNYQNLDSARIAVRMMIVQPRYASNIDYAAASTTWLNCLLKKGGTTTAFTGLISDLYSPINTDVVIKYYDKIHYLSLPLVQTSAGTTNVNTAYTSDIRQTVKFFTKTFRFKNKQLRYDSTFSSALYPMNYAPILLLGYSHLNGSSPDTVNTQVALNYNAILDYEDA